MEREQEENETEERSGTWLKVYYLATFILVGALCFGAGLLTKLWQSPVPLAISVVSPVAAETPAPLAPPEEQPEAARATGPSVPTPPVPAEQCAYVGSKNSTKYHLPSCSYAKRILPENKVCFASPEDAERQGYTAGCLK